MRQFSITLPCQNSASQIPCQLFNSGRAVGVTPGRRVAHTATPSLLLTMLVLVEGKGSVEARMLSLSRF
jgi:hypothetical protein